MLPNQYGAVQSAYTKDAQEREQEASQQMQGGHAAQGHGAGLQPAAEAK